MLKQKTLFLRLNTIFLPSLKRGWTVSDAEVEIPSYNIYRLDRSNEQCPKLVDVNKPQDILYKSARCLKWKRKGYGVRECKSLSCVIIAVEITTFLYVITHLGL